MKTKILFFVMLPLMSTTSIFAQDRTTVTATNSDISDNLDLRAVASIFGESRDLEDFERRLNDPRAQISNLDLNGDNRVDYLRVIESVEGNTHLIIIQSVLGLDTYQDIATVEVERDRFNKIQVQVVGDVYMYGNNYIYEPVYAYTPIIYTSFWVTNYRPYYSSWYWGYYPGFYVAWAPYPVYTYHNHIGICINFHNHYNYVNYRRCSIAYNNYYNGRRGNAYERQYPNRSFVQRNTGFSNRRELVTDRSQQTFGARNNSTVVNTPRPVRTSNNPRSITTEANTRNTEPTRSYSNTSGTRNSETPRSYGNVGNPRNNESPRTYGNTRGNESPRTFRNNGNSESPRGVISQGNPGIYEGTRNQSPRNIERNESPRNSSPRQFSEERGNSQRGGGEGNSRGNRRS
ncbi:MAG TPA: hypothetical protein PKN96_03205 [Flavobacterium sp.]|uniref:hypothetical protein n=1 Tax=Flavobacterium sp. TaxID=239 RepID=UPI002BB42CB7|nr:hypothetical protein [Flavobacterium sp.]HNP32279.1 hypothetical protein [Flavobacterium sp.]